MSREDPQMKIRLPAELKAQIETAAKDSNRTLNAEIVARLQRSFEVPASFLAAPTKIVSFTGDGTEQVRTAQEMMSYIADSLQDLTNKLNFLNYYASGTAAEVAATPLPEPTKDDLGPESTYEEMEAAHQRMFPDGEPSAKPAVFPRKPAKTPTPSPNAGKPKR